MFFIGLETIIYYLIIYKRGRIILSNKGINKYVQDNFKDKIVKECENFFESHRYMVREELGFKCYSGNLICGDSNINSCIAYDKNDKIGFDIIVIIKIFGTIRKG